MTVAQAVESVRDRHDDYCDYFLNRVPAVTADGVFERFLFGLLTVNYSWETSVVLFLQLRRLPRPAPLSVVRMVLAASRCGFHETRARMVWLLSGCFSAGCAGYVRSPAETYSCYRDRISGAVHGLGVAKSSFVTEMLHPRADVACLDRHMTRSLFPDGAGYRGMERDWCDACGSRGMHPAASRLAYWDRMKGERSPRFWSFVFEEESNG